MAHSGPKPLAQAESVVVVHPHALICEGIVKILQEAGFNVVGQAGSGHSLFQLAAQHDPDIMLVDWESSEITPDTIRVLTEKLPRVAVVILTQPQSTEALLPVLEAGATGYLSVNLSAQEFVQALRMLAKGDIVISQEMAGEVKIELATEQASKSKDGISGREQEVLQLVCQGATNREIAARLIVSEHTVKVHLRNILNKLNLRNRQQVAAYAVQEGLVTDIKSEDASGSTA
ncbi:MAG TPA: response regulator transcription factor [Chloroflexi bacterium]|nr:response regulator transcription factor [Chloroflexota bacterium]